MENPNLYQKEAEELGRKTRAKNFPLALKLLESEKDIPEGAQRPLRDYGYRLSICQSFNLARYEGPTIAMLEEDMWCSEPMIGLGLKEPPKDFMEGHTRYPADTATLEGGSIYANELPKLEVGKYVGVVVAPFKWAKFEPDLVMIYCDTLQLNMLLLAMEWKDGHNLKCAISSHASCVYSVVPIIQGGKWQVTIPCRGDRYYAMAGDGEIIFTCPMGKFNDLMTALRSLEQTGSKLPRGYAFQTEYGPQESGVQYT
jgi:uncharacterized protein (DUF169 family)